MSRKQRRHGSAGETLQQRCVRLRNDAEKGGDAPSALFYSAMTQALALKIPEKIQAANLILLLGEKYRDNE